MINIGLKKVVDKFEYGNVSISGLRGRGKDILMSNVVARRKKPYISNIDYQCEGCEYIPFNINDFNVNNTYDNFLNNDLNYYDCKYADGIDIYLSDCGILFPSQYQDQLCKKYPFFPTFLSLQRQLNLSNTFVNSQFLGRVWDKIREQGDIYIVCRKCIVIGKLVILFTREYEKYESAEKNVPPFRYNVPILANSVVRSQINLAKQNYTIQYGNIDTNVYIFFNKSNYDTRAFKKALKGGKKRENKKTDNNYVCNLFNVDVSNINFKQ